MIGVCLAVSELPLWHDDLGFILPSWKCTPVTFLKAIVALALGTYVY